MSHRCPECLVNWWPYQARGGVCPQCGRGVVLRVDDPDEDSVVLHRAALARQDIEERKRRFEQFCERRDERASLDAFIAEFGERLR